MACTVEETMDEEQNVCQRGAKIFWEMETDESIILRSVFNMSTRYGLDGPPIDSRWRRDYPDRPWAPPSLLYNGYRVSFRE
jgi:hypothetical protein